MFTEDGVAPAAIILSGKTGSAHAARGGRTEHDFIAGTDPSDSLADALHDAGHIGAQDVRHLEVESLPPQPNPQVEAIECDGFDAHAHLTWPYFRIGNLPD